MSGSPYLQKPGGGSSPYLQETSSAGSPYLQNGGSGSAPKPKPGGILGAIEGAGHWVGQKAALTGHDLLSIPGGLLQAGKAVEEAQLLGNPKPLLNLGKAQVEGTVQTLEHPLRDPFQTITTIAPMLHGLGKVADVASGGQITEAPRLIEPRPGAEKIPLHASKNPSIRLLQHAYDGVIQKALRENPGGRIAGHAMNRLRGSIEESGRATQRMNMAPANTLEAAGRKFSKVEQAALRLTSENSTPEEASAFHRAQAAKGIEPGQNLKQADLYDRVAKARLVVRDAKGNAVINADEHPHLAALDKLVAEGQKQVDATAEKFGLMTKEGLEARRNGPARIRAGGSFQQNGTVPDAAKEAAKLEAEGQLSLAPRTAEEAVGKGLIGGEGARPGRGYVTYRSSLPKAAKSPAAASPGPVVGAVKSFIPSKEITYQNLEAGKVPDNTTRLVAQNMRDAARYVNTHQFRSTIAKAGSDTKLTNRDVLVLKPGEKGEPLPTEIKQAVGKERSTLDELPNLEPEQHGLEAFLRNIVPGRGNDFALEGRQSIGTQAPEHYVWVDRHLLGDLGRPAVTGVRGKIARGFDNVNSAVTAATVYFKIGHVPTRTFTNAATNIIQGSANPLQIGKSVELWKSLDPLDRQRALAASGQHGYQAMPVAEGIGRVSQGIGKAARGGANWWAKHVDAPFRFNSIAYEARKAGFAKTPEDFKRFLDVLQSHGEGVDAATWAKVSSVAKRANREGIAYDRLSSAERNIISRAFWFYPWTAGATRFAVNTLLEHPYKSALLGNAGVEGRKSQTAELGLLPSYEQGLVKLAGAKGRGPLVSDFSTLQPFATPGQLLQVPSFGTLSQFLNPGYAALLQAGTRTDQYGQHTNKPITTALGSLGTPIPEASIVKALVAPPKNQDRHMFATSPLLALERALAGSSVPRRLNVAAAHRAYGREKSGR
jgi:hypothetical protein